MRIQAKCQQRLGFNTIFLSSVHCIEAWYLQHLSCISFVHMYQHLSGKLYAHSSHISTTFRFHLSVSFSCPWQPLYTTFKLHLFTHIEVTSVLHRIAVYLGDIELNQILAHTQFRHNQSYCNIDRIESNCIAHNFAVIKIIMSPIYDNDFFFSILCIQQSCGNGFVICDPLLFLLLLFFFSIELTCRIFLGQSLN